MDKICRNSASRLTRQVSVTMMMKMRRRVTLPRTGKKKKITATMRKVS